MSDVAGFELDPARMSPSAVRGMRASLAVSAVLAIVLGVMILVWTQATVVVAGILFGIYFVVLGVLRIARGVMSGTATAGSRVLNIVLGLLLLIAGVLAVRYLETTVVLLALILGIAWIVEGIAALVESTRDGSRWMGIAFGVLSLIGGIVVLMLPEQSLTLLIWIGGVLLIMVGVVQLVQAFTFGRGARPSAQAA